MLQHQKHPHVEGTTASNEGQTLRTLKISIDLSKKRWTFIVRTGTYIFKDIASKSCFKNKFLYETYKGLLKLLKRSRQDTYDALVPI